MTLKEKAIELVEKFEPYVIRYTQDDVVGYLVDETPILEYQKQCALIAVDELIYETQFEVPNIRQKYWIEVKQEIENL
jgi:crotonobetainyl-CoA:carnitine CoA-transferase CaiB-like acyl-CoA transferase